MQVGKGSGVHEVLIKASADAEHETTDDLLAAFKGEITASAKYAAWSKKAEQDGFHQIAVLFKAVSAAENIHAGNHKTILEEAGIKPLLLNPQFTVKSTKENLQDAIKGEIYESTIMYPEFIKDAGSSGIRIALLSLTYAYETEKKHRVMFENALAALENNTVKSLSSEYFVCPTCGNTYDSYTAKRCSICIANSKMFIKIK